MWGTEMAGVGSNGAAGTELVRVETQPPALFESELQRAADYAKSDKAPASRRAYQSDFVIFQAWCCGRGLRALPASPEAVAAFLAAEVDRGIKPSTIGRRVAAIRYAHKLAGQDIPTEDERVRATLRGI